MYKQRIGLFIFLFSIGTGQEIFSQIASGTSSVGGCLPFNATYVAPSGASGHSWNFGDASGITTFANGSHNYTGSGTFACTYTGTVGGSPVNFTVMVHVFPKPVPNFVIAPSSNNCVVKTVTLTNQSTSSSAISSWLWTYGDGGSAVYSNGNPHTYGYTLPGTYSISLKVTDIHGCDDQVTIGTVSVFATPTAVIGSTPANLTACTPPFIAAFASSIAAPTGATYSWNFGNSQTSTLANPGNITYGTVGSFTVSLTITANGCSSTNTRVVVVNPPTLAATAPSTICLNAPFTVTVQSNQPFLTWNLGGGILAYVSSFPVTSQQTISSVFTSTGLKTITVTAGTVPCTTTLAVNVYVDQVIANYTSPLPNNSCSSPFQVNLVNSSTPNANQFVWIMPTSQGDTITFTGAGPNPVFTYTQGSLNPYTNFKSIYNLPYAPTVTLIATSAAGCTGTVSHTYDSITRPTASFYKNKRHGCVPLTVTFTDNSFVFPLFNPISSYTWCNGASPPVFATGTGSNIPNQIFSYNNTGTYTPYLIIQTASGCIDISFSDTIIVSTPPIISFSINPPFTVCPNQVVQTTNTSAQSVIDAVDHWHVQSDNGFFAGCISDPNPGWKFTHVGVHGFTMTAYVNGCMGTAVAAQNVTVNGPIVTSRYETNCGATTRNSVNFYSHLQATPNYTLSFGDNTTRIVSGNTSVSDFTPHVYSANGNYLASLRGENSGTGCPASTYTMLVTVRDAQAVVSGDSIVCTGVQKTFTASGSVDVFSGCSRGYVWYIDNLAPVDKATPTHTATFLSTGIHTVKLVVKDVNSCMDTTKFYVRASSVTPAFSFAPPSVCVNASFQVINASTSVPLDPLSSYFWNFGSGQTSNLISPTYTYTSANSPFSTYNVFLTVVNNKGCSATTVQPINVIKPNTTFYASQNNFCIGAAPVTVSYSAQGPAASYTMNFGTTPISTLVTTSNNSTFSYSQAGTYFVTLKARDATGCEATSSPQMLVAEKTPTANFTFSSPKSNGGNVICAPGANVSFTAGSGVGSSPVTSYTWNLGTGAPVLSQPTVAYLYNNISNTTIVVSLTVQTALGCTSAQTKTFNLYTPKANIVASKTTVCIGEAITFNIKDTTGRGILAWNWDFGNNNTTDTVYAFLPTPPSSTVQPFTIFNQPNGEIEVNLIYYSSQKGCKDFAKLNIRVIQINADFKRNAEATSLDYNHCINIPDQFYNVSPSSSAFPVSWNFGNGITSALENPVYTYTQSGIYQVSLTVTGEQSCKGLSTKSMTINPLPIANILSEDSICRDAPFELTGAGTSTAGITGYTWSPASGVNNPNISPTTGFAPATSDFSLIVVDGNGCVSTPTVKNIYIQQPAPSLQWDTTVIVGQSVTINANVGPNFSYSWSPVVDLNCVNCFNPNSSSTVNVTYSVEVQDNMGCFRVTNTYTIFVDPQTSVDVPTAFTPNGDGTNDLIYVDGWGIKKLNYFKIYNRWGQLLFESNDIKIGWDGTFNGVPQNMETYVYQVSVETFTDKEGLIKTSSFRLIR